MNPVAAAAAVSELVAEVVGRQLLSSDFFVAAEDGLLVCLPERDHKATADFVERLSLAIHRSVRPDLAAWITVTSTNAVERLIGSDA